jgi:hypothetical protein
MAVYRSLGNVQQLAYGRPRIRLFDLAPDGKFQAAHDALGPVGAIVPVPQANQDPKVDDGQQPKHASIYRVHINH